MTQPPMRTVILVDSELPVGLAVNAASITACMVTTAYPHLMGPATAGRDGQLPGVVLAPLPVLASTRAQLRHLWDQTSADDTLTAFPFSNLAQSCKTYDEYIDKMAATTLDALELSSLGVAGPPKRVKSLTGHIPLYPPKAQ